jgi:hypothetical protein
MSQLPESVHAVVVGAGIHGLSTGWHLGLELARRRRGSGQDVVVLDKTGVGAGASGIACGCVRNLYMTEPLHAILRHSVDVWTYDPVAFGFQQVGYVGVDEEQNLPAYDILVGEGADIVGTNCGRDPDRMLPVVEIVRRATPGYVAAQPIGFRTRDDRPNFTQLAEFPLALDSLTLSRAEMGAYATRARTLGVNYIGSCCGSVAHHVRAMAEALGRRPPASAKSADLDRHPGIQRSRTLDEMAGRRPKSAEAPRFATGDRNW